MDVSDRPDPLEAEYDRQNLAVRGAAKDVATLADLFDPKAPRPAVPPRGQRALVCGRDLREGGRPVALRVSGSGPFGQTNDVYVSARRDIAAARRFFTRVRMACCSPTQEPPNGWTDSAVWSPRWR